MRDTQPKMPVSFPPPGNDRNSSSALVRQLPRNEEVEVALLGALLRDNRSYEKVAEALRAEHFSAPVHQRIYGCIAKLIDAGQEARPTTLRHLLEQDPLIVDVGGVNYLYELIANVVTVLNVASYAETIRDLYLKRELIRLGETVVNEAYDVSDPLDTAEKQVERAEHHLYEVVTTGRFNDGLVSLKDATVRALDSAAQAFRKETHVVGVTTGFRPIDGLLGGLHPSDLIILAGRPAMGKTALATTIAYNAARRYRSFKDKNGRVIEEGGKVLFFSMEMSAEQLAGRLLSAAALVSSDKIRRGDITEQQFRNISEASRTLHELPFFIDDTPALSSSGLRQRARRMKRLHGLNLIVIDYLQLMQGAPDRRSDNRVQEVSEITRGLKALAKELNVPVLALSQLSRQVEQREDKHPQLSDLRESGSIEQDADVVGFVYREEYYLQQQPPEERATDTGDKFEKRLIKYNERLAESKNVAKFIIAKQRHGPVGTVELYFDADHARFGDPIDRAHSGPSA